MKITAILGSYRKGGVTDSAVDEILSAAAECGAEVAKIYLTDKHIEYCTNCRACTQEPGQRHGQCPTVDDMRAILDELEQSDAIVIASPMNFGSVTAVTKKFMERLICFAYWPWGPAIPKIRDKRKTKLAVVVASSSAPSIISRLFNSMLLCLIRQRYYGSSFWVSPSDGFPGDDFGSALSWTNYQET